MKLIATEGGRVLDLVPLEELRPPGGVFLPDLIQATIQRYQFAITPTNLAEATKVGAKFEHGKFKLNDDASIVIKELAVYNDGLISDAYNTDLAEAVLTDFIGWATETYKLRARQRPARRTYTSAVYIEFEKQVDPAIGKMAAICELLTTALQSSYGWEHKYNLRGLTFAVDPQTTPQHRNTNFSLERRLNERYSENRYYSLAPLRTGDHLTLLETIEREFLA